MLEQRIVETIRRELPATVAIYLFGSHAAGRARSDSDVDVAVLLDGDLSSLRRWEVQERLAAEIHRRCLARVREEHASDDRNPTRLDDFPALTRAALRARGEDL